MVIKDYVYNEENKDNLMSFSCEHYKFRAKTNIYINENQKCEGQTYFIANKKTYHLTNKDTRDIKVSESELKKIASGDLYAAYVWYKALQKNKNARLGITKIPKDNIFIKALVKLP